MKYRLVLTVILFLSGNGLSVVKAVTVQDSQHVFNGRSYLYVEAEDFSTLGADLDNNGWKVVSKTAPVTSVGGLDILPAGTNASGNALLDDIGGSHHDDTATYEVQFMTAGTYQFYTRHSMYDRNGNGHYRDEDSIFVSPGFNLNSESDWVGYQGLDFDELDPNVDIPIPGFALDPNGFKPTTSDSSNDGWLAIRDWGVKSAGVVTFPNDATGPEWNGNFNWYHRPAYVSSNSSGLYDGEYGFKTEFIVTPGQVGQTLTFEIGSREAYGVLDGFLFIRDDNVDLLDIYTQAELDAVLPVSLDGDFNSDGTVDGYDFLLWQLNPSVGNLADWETNYAQPLQSNVAVVPEPSSVVLLLGFYSLVGRRSLV